MSKLFTVLQVIVPIFTAVFLGVIARKKKLLTQEENQGLQQFVIRFGLPCVIFNSCLTADIGVESLSSMALTLPFVLVAALGAFSLRKKKRSFHNLPMLFAAKESGMLGIPLFLILFGADQAYRMGVLDLTQSIIAIPTIAILSAVTSEKLSPVELIKRILTSPLLIMSVLGLILNLTGIGRWMDAVGIGGILTESTGFLGQPISAMMIFSVGYNFSLATDCRAAIFKISAVHFLWYAVAGLVIQGCLFLVPGVDAMTRWAILLYTTLPASYIAPSLGRTEEDYTVASGVCSVLTVVCLLVFCMIAVFVA